MICLRWFKHGANNRPGQGLLGSPLLTGAAFLLWLAAVTAGIGALWRYSGTPGESRYALTQWPDGSRLELSTQKPTLIMFLHPHCPCSRATIGELAVLLGRNGGDFATQIVFLQPEDKPATWSNTPLWRAASSLPRVATIEDEGGREGRLFQAETSGETFLFEPGGKLVFHGGMTVARGHSGDNDGLRALVAIREHKALTASPTSSTPVTSTPVFGCPLNGQCSLSEPNPSSPP